MSELSTREIRKRMIEENNLQIPYNADGFVKWLIESSGKSEQDAYEILAKVREADLELWKPNESVDFFSIIAEWHVKAQNCTDYVMVRHLHSDIINAMNACVIILKYDSADSGNAKTFEQWIKAYQWYLRFLNDWLKTDYQSRFHEFLPNEQDEKDETGPHDNHEDGFRFPFEDEFEEYLDSTYPPRTKQKICANLSCLNKILNKNPRKELPEDLKHSSYLLLEYLYDNGFKKNLNDIIRLINRVDIDVILDTINETGDQLVEQAWKYNISESTAQNCKTALTRYIEFLNYRKHKKSA
ncbi:MAG: hypothetical protein K2J42_00995 [Muribaculaceae bacterium]|nr:hypothetical protein [Muribaculaceae bacterium]